MHLGTHSTAGAPSSPAHPACLCPLSTTHPPPPPLLAEKCAAVTVSLYAPLWPEIAPFSQGRDKATTSISSNVRGLNHPGLEGLNLYLRQLRARIIFLSRYRSPLLLSLFLRLKSRVHSQLCSVCVCVCVYVCTWKIES